jgi:uncharacterized protein (TIGR03435 family)
MTLQSSLLRIASLSLSLVTVPALTLPAQTAPANSPASSAAANSAASAPRFDLADVHPSPFANQPDTDIEWLSSGRFYAHQATMVSLINFAWNVDTNRVLRGPSWLDFDRFDIVARAPRGASQDDFRLMLRRLLADRFALTVHSDTKTIPAYVLTVDKGGPKMKAVAQPKPPAGNAEDNVPPPQQGCRYVPPPQPQPAGSAPQPISFSCKAVSMDDFIQFLHNQAYGGGNYLTSAVVDQTGLTGVYDFNFAFTNRGQLGRAGADGINLFDAIAKLGLKLEAKPAPLPVVFVDAANEKPTPNAPGIDKTLAPPAAEFEVAVLKPSAPDEKDAYLNVRGSEVLAKNISLQLFITWLWDINDDMIVDPPKWLNQDKWDLLAKLAVDPSASTHNGQPDIDFEQIQGMVKKLLADRFGLQVHMADHPADAYVLVAAGPHMQKADPDNRTGCHNGPGPDGKDPRLTNPVLNRLLTCQNMTMAQFGDILRINASGYIHSPVLDQTGLKDAYDFTLSFSGAGQLQNGPKQGDSSDASDPNGAISLFDAVQKQMGVKLVLQKRPIQMLVIDHINESPTEN